MRILQNTEGRFQWDCAVTAHLVADGPVFQNESIAVSACHNHHLPMENGAYQSFSYRIEAESKSLVYSGDIKALADLDDAVGAGCDVLLAETGHHTPEEVCAYANRKNVKTLLFLHHGRHILQNPLHALLQAQAVFHGPVAICEDGTFFDI